MKKEKKVSIIVPFTSLNEYVTENVKNCLKLDYSNFELILLPDDKIVLPQEIRDKRVKIIKTGDLNISEKRNIGIRHAKSDFYAFIDSDAYPVSEWLKNAVECFEQASADTWIVGGPNITPPNEPSLKKAVGNSSKSFLVTGKNSFRKKISFSRFCEDLPSCNLIVKKEAIEKLKGFDERLVTGEDIDFCRRIIKENKKIYYDNKVVVYHHNRSLFLPFLLQRITYGLSVFKMLKIKISFQTLSFLMPMLFLIFLVLGEILSIFNNLIFRIWLFFILIYLFLVFIETIKYSEKISEIPLTFVAILIGNLSPGIGSLMALFKIKVNIRKIYKNYGFKEDSINSPR